MTAITYTEIKDRARRLVGADSTSYTDAEITVDMNERLNEVVAVLMRSDKRWQWDDFNHADMNIFFAPLVDGQQDYEVSGATFITIQEVAVKKLDEKYAVLKRIIREGGNAQRLASMEDGDTGMPTHYEVMGNSVYLYPKPKLSLLTASEGFRVRGQRLPDYFTTADSSQQPGFNPLYGKALAIGCALDFAMDNEMVNKINILQPQYDRKLLEIGEDYVNRSEDDEAQATPHSEGYGVSTL